MELKKEAFNSLVKYFNLLFHTGYKSYSEVAELILFLFVEEVLSGPMSEFITDIDYKHITSCLNNIYGSCMIPYPSYKKTASKITIKPWNLRITEEYITRSSENDSLRVIS